MNNADEILALLDKHCPPPGAVARIGLTPEQVRALTRPRAEGPAPADAQTIRRALAQRHGKLNHGSAALPDYVIKAMAVDYARLGSLRKVGALYQRTAATIAYIFKRHGVPLKGRGGRNHVTPTREVVALRRSYEELRSLRKVARRHGRDMSTVWAIFRRHGVSVNRSGVTNR